MTTGANSHNKHSDDGLNKRIILCKSIRNSHNRGQKKRYRSEKNNENRINNNICMTVKVGKSVGIKYLGFDNNSRGSLGVVYIRMC